MLGLGLLVGLPGLPAIVSAEEAGFAREPARWDLAGTWRSHPGDDLAWADPAFDDSAWRTVPLPASWEAQGYQGLDGFVWYRREIPLSPGLRDLAREGRLGLLLGPPIFGAIEVWAGGLRTGRTRGWDLALPVPRETVILLPAEAVARDASFQPTLLLALRVRSVGWASAISPVGGPVGGPDDGRVVLAAYEELTAAAGYRWNRLLLADLPLLLLAVVIGVAGLYHLLLYLRRRQEAQYLWFGWLALAYAVNTLAISWWIFELTDRRDLVLRLGDASGHLAAALAIQFLWPFFGRSIGRWLRGYQLSQLGIAGVLLFWPQPAIVLDTVGVRWLWLLPLLVAAAWVVVTELRRRTKTRPEARWIAAGGLVLVLAEVHQISAVLGVGELPLSLVPFGFAAVVLGMAAALGHRFRRLLDELEELREDLEARVTQRTAELERRNEQLQRSRQRTEQVFVTLSEVMEGQELDGRYRLEERIGSGGHAAVYRATHTELRREVAVKIFQPVRADGDLAKDLERFRREGVTACRVDHPNAVSVLDSGITVTGIAYLVMELLHGRDLGWEMRHRAPMSPARCAEILVPVCEVLAVAEEAGVVHRDIKPGNIFLHRVGGHEVVKVVDFGIARLFGSPLTPGEAGDTELQLTRTGHLLGTPPYLAPERISGEPGDVEADVYSVGLVLYEMLTGSPSYRTESGGIDYRRLFSLEPPKPLAEVAPEVPEELVRVVERTLARDPEDRPGFRELARELARFHPEDKKIPGEGPAGDRMGPPPGCLGTTP